ncbi:HAMP domain-containing protein [Halovenus rubra]|uniref:HAMP domain-containing protein n=2 Tax=Halovenus rubra TaxID=869890 RepID=A0ABD5X3E0_9EURY|nr:HAMP domain-containing protein [Halovenus rubra]
MGESAATDPESPEASADANMSQSGARRIVPSVVASNLIVKLVVGILLIVLLAGGIAFYFQSGIADELDSQVKTQVEETAGLHSDIYTAWEGNRFDELRSIAGEEVLDQSAERPRSDRLTRARNNLDSFQQLHLVDTESGEVIASSAEEAVGENMFEMVDESFIGESGAFTTPYQYTSLTGETVVGFGRQRLLDDTHVLLGEVPATGGPNFRQTIEGSNTVIANQEGDVVFGESGVDPAVVGEGLSITVTRNDGEIHASTTFGERGLTVVTSSPESEAFALRDSVLRSFVIMLVLVFGVLIISTVIGGRSIASSITKLNDRAKEMGEGDLSVDLETSRRDEIGELYAGFASMRDSLQERISETEDARDEAETARKEAEVARAEAEELASYLQERTEEYSEIMRQVGMGDMTQRMTPDGEEESMDTIATEFNDMIEELEKTTGQLKSYVNEVEEAGAEVEQSAQTVRDASEQVADSIQKISDDAYNQKERLQAVSETMDKVTTELESMATVEGVDIQEPLANLQTMASNINEIAELSEETMAEAEDVAGAAEEQAAELNEVSKRANDLQQYAQPLRDILGRFETEAEHEFVFSVGPTGGAQSPTSRSPDEE